MNRREVLCSIAGGLAAATIGIWEEYMAQKKPKDRGLELQIFPTTFGSEQNAPGE